jgi:hypothetical protein
MDKSPLFARILAGNRGMDSVSNMRASALVAFMATAMVAGGCQAPVATIERTIAGNPAAPYRGMSKEEIMACAGQPASVYSHSSGETLVYHYSGSGPVPGAEKKKDSGNPLEGRKSSGDWTCTASLVFENGRLERVTYAHRDVESPYKKKTNPETGKKEYITPPEPCSFSLPNCVRR